MRKKWSLVALGAAAGMLLGFIPASSVAAQEKVQIVKPVTEVRQSLGLTYPEGKTLSVKFRGTERLPKASGEAKVETKKGATEIEIELDEMKPAYYFGGDYNCYVLWIVSPEGHVDNGGEFILEGNRSKLNVSTPLETFGMFVTAEPHYLVRTPSRFVVLENTRPTDKDTPLKTSQITYRGYEGVYRFDQETLVREPEAKGEIRVELRQARTAVELAERAGAAEFAPQELAQAREAYDRTGNALEARRGKREVNELGREAVRLAVEAQKLAEDRSAQASLDAERKASSEEAARLERSMKEAQSDAERERLQKEQERLRAQMEAQARQEAQRRADQEALRAAQAERQARKAETDAERAQRERAELQARLQQALGSVVEIRMTARGLIVNLPDILFDFNRATLRPEAREVLSKLSGILLVTGDTRLSVEGHADSIGTEEYNQGLSQRRAQSVRDFLVANGISGSLVTSEGFGETRPIASNTKPDGSDDPAGRQRNRRVEIVIHDRTEVGRNE
jgi:outer membrane protein OmpA-like peptidoglycan-associated protein